MKYNKSKTFLLPLLSEMVGFEAKFMRYLVNTYMYNDISEEGEECLCILHDFSFRNPEFTAYEHRLIKNDLFLKSVDVDNSVLYIFKFPEEYLAEFYLLEQGKYSEFGEDAKELILKFWSDVYINNNSAIPFLIKTKQILYKDPKLRERLEKELKVTIGTNAELGESIDEENEKFNIKEFANTNKKTA
jgi:hypothetical protein